MSRVDVLWGDDDGTPRVTPATLEDRSQGGASVRMKDPIRVGSYITIRWRGEQISGTVTHHRREKAVYILGVQRDAGESLDRN